MQVIIIQKGFFFTMHCLMQWIACEKAGDITVHNNCRACRVKAVPFQQFWAVLPRCHAFTLNILLHSWRIVSCWFSLFSTTCWPWCQWLLRFTSIPALRTSINIVLVKMLIVEDEEVGAVHLQQWRRRFTQLLCLATALQPAQPQASGALRYSHTFY